MLKKKHQNNNKTQPYIFSIFAELAGNANTKKKKKAAD